MTKSLGLLLMLVAACGKSDAEKFADAYCAEVAKCCAEAGMPADGKQCHQVVSVISNLGSYNAKAGDACVAEMRSMVEADPSCTSEAPSCDAVFRGGSFGEKQLGEACEYDEDCARSHEGEVACDWYSGSLTCIALREVGEACKDSFYCVSSAYCDQDRVCAARLSAGSACTMNRACMDGYYCPADTRQCAALQDDGAVCQSSSECNSDSCKDGTCQASGPDELGLQLACGSK